MRVLIWGAGAIGGIIGAHLVRAGHDITFVDRATEHVDAMNAKGLSITGPLDQFRVPAVAFTPEAVTGTWECVLLCTKAQHTEEAARALQAHVSDTGYVVSVQNGLNELTIAKVVGEERTVGAFVNFGGDYLEPGVVHYGGRGAVVLGEIDGSTTSRLQELHRLFLEFDDAAITSSNIWGFLWSKLAYGALLFATALTNASIADALDADEYHGLYVELAEEVLRVALAQGVTPEPFNGFDPRAFLPGASRAAALESIDDMVAFNRKSAKTHSGIWRDLAVRKRSTEAEDQLGPIVTFGSSREVPTPLTSKLIALVHEIEVGERQQGWEALDELRATLAAPLGQRSQRKEEPWMHRT